MHDQPKFFPQRGTSFYSDGRSVRPQVENTVARNQLHEDAYFNTGLVAGKEGAGLPFPVTMQVLQRGQERFNVYCTPCHSRVGNGGGMIVQRGYSAAANFQGGRLRAVPLGHFFHVITNGYGSMPDYAAQLTPVDRWAIAAYIRALQLSQNAQRTDVPAGAEVKPLASIAAAEGLPESYAADWDVSAPAAMPGSTDASAPPATSQTPAGTGSTTSAMAGAALVGDPSVTPSVSAKPIKQEISARLASAGKVVYSKNCQVCHAEQLTGHPPTYPSLVNIASRLSADHMRSQIIHGVPPMPPFPNLSSGELDKLIAYLTEPSKADRSAKTSN